MYFSRGVIHMLLSGFFFTLMNVFVKLLPGIPSTELVFFRSTISIIISLGILGYYGINPWGTGKKLLLLRGLVGTLALILQFELMQHVPLASAMTILFLTPIFANVLGIFMLNEKVYPVQWIFFLISFTGIVIVKGFDPRISTFYLVLGIFTALLSAFSYNFIRKINKTEHPVVIMFYFTLLTVPVTGVITAFTWLLPSGIEWVYILFIGLFTQLAQYYMTKAYQAEKISRIANLQYINIIYALLFGYFLFHETFNYIIYAGMFLALGGVMMNLVYKKS